MVKALLSYPLPYYAVCELLEKELFLGKPETKFPSIWSLDGELKVWGLVFRVCVVVVTIVFAVVVPHFTILMGLFFMNRLLNKLKKFFHSTLSGL